MLKKILFFVVPAALLFSQEYDPYVMSDYGGEPSGIVEGCVNVITGDFVVRRDDLVVKGHEPIRIPLNYSPRDVKKIYSVYGGWNFAEKFLVISLDYTDSLNVYERSGICLEYFYNDFCVKSKKKAPLSLREPHGGLTNTALGEITARQNPLNNVVFPKPGDPKEVIVEAPDGSVRYYRTKECLTKVKGAWYSRSQPIDFLLRTETLPNGNVIKYIWEKLGGERWRVKRIESRSATGKVYAWVNVGYDPGDDKHRKKLTFSTSDGRSVRYSFDTDYNLRGKRISLLKKIDYSFKPLVKYTYWQSEKSDIYPEWLVMPNDRRMQVRYYHLGKNSDSGEKIKEKSERYTRVKALYQPLHDSSEVHRSHLFCYCPGKYKKGGGSADVFDAHGNLTRYGYNRHFVLNSIDRFIGDKHLFSKEVFNWTERNWLQSKALVGRDNVPLYAFDYRYDSYGNITFERQYGNLTGKSDPNCLKLCVSNVECDRGDEFTIAREYSEKHLLTKETFSNGKVVEYSYVSGTDLLCAKIESDSNKKLQRRTFYLYEGSLLTAEITDNGTGRFWNELEGVTQRLIKVITPNPNEFMYGMPHVIEEKYLDLERMQEVSLGKRVIYYDKKALGNASRVEHYDAHGKYLYTLSFKYDERDRLIAQTDPLGRERKVKYDANDNPIFDHDPNENFALSQVYDFMNRPTITTQKTSEGAMREVSNGYNFLGQKVEEKDFRGNVTYQEHNPFGHPVKTTFPSILTESGRQMPKIERTFNAMGKPLTEVDPEGNVTQSWYTARGKPYRILHSDGAEEFFTYDASGYHVTSHTSSEGVRTEYVYDVFDRVVEKRVCSTEGEILSRETFLYDAFNVLSKTDPDGVVTAYSYDGAGRKIREETLGRVTAYEYDSLGRLHRVIRNDEQVLIKEYDLLSRVIEERQEDTGGCIYSFTTYEYDDFSNKIALTKEVKIGDAVERLFYDSFRRLIKRIDPMGHVTTIDYDDYFENELGQKVLCKTTTDPMGKKTIETFDAFDNLSSLEKQDAQGQTLLHEKFFYNLNQQKTKQVSTLFNPDKKIIKTWAYDSRSRVTELKEAALEPIEKVTTFTYTLDGHLETMTKPDGTVISYAYDALGRQTSIQTSDGTCHYELTYDQMGNVTQSEDLVHHRLTARTYSHFGELLTETQANQQSLRKTYDHLGRKTALIFSNGSKVLYDYDPYHLAKVERISRNGTSLYAHYYTEYDRSFNLTEELLASREPIYHTVDLLSRRIESDSPYSNEQMTDIDPCGNVRKYQRVLDGAVETSEFDYDFLDQLIEERGLFQHHYAYDSHHNRLQKDASIYEVNALHELESTTESNYKHDPNGNRILSTKDQAEYTYDGLDRLVQMRSGEVAIRFSYDSWNRCQTVYHLQLYEGSWHLKYSQDLLYDEQNELGAFPHQLRILGQGRGAEIGAAVAIEQDHRVYIPMHDLFGNIIALLDSKTNETQEYYRYTVFGEEQIFSASGCQITESLIHNPWRYQSKRKVDQLVAFGRRFYDPETGRWLSPDPKGFDEGPNLYQFVLNNPLAYFDLYGLSTVGGEGYSVKRFVMDVAYVQKYAVGSYLKDVSHVRFGLKNNPTYHVFQGIRNVVRGDRRAPDVGRPGFEYVGSKIHPDVDYYFLPGILNTGADALSSGGYISEKIGGYRVGVLKNETIGILGDLAKFCLERLGFQKGITEITREKVLESVSSGKQAVLILNSAGAAITYNALKKVPSDQRLNIDLFSFGGARTFSQDFARTAENYISGNDLVAQTAGFFDYAKALRYEQANVHFLKVNSANPFKEHRLMEQTYRTQLNETCDFLIERYGIPNEK